MSLPDFCTWDGGTTDEGTEPPRRPSAEDCGGDEKLDDEEFPPDEKVHPTSQGWNQKVKQTVALSRMSASGKLEVDFSGGAPFVAAAAGCAAAVAPGTFTPNDNGTGDTSITWPADTFPPFIISPNGLTLYSSGTAPLTGYVEKITNGIRVRTFSWNGSAWVAANIPWSINLN